MLLSKSSLGISFGDDRVDLVSLRRSFGKTTVVKHLSIPFVYGMKKEEFESNVSDFLKVNRLQRMMSYVALPRRDCMLLPLELPVTTEENLREVLGYELDNYTPFSVNTAYFYFQNLGHTLNGGKEYAPDSENRNRLYLQRKAYKYPTHNPAPLVNFLQ